MASKKKRGKRLITEADACVLAKIRAAIENSLIYACSKLPTFIVFIAPKASLTVANHV